MNIILFIYVKSKKLKLSVLYLPLCCLEKIVLFIGIKVEVRCIIYDILYAILILSL